MINFFKKLIGFPVYYWKAGLYWWAALAAVAYLAAVGGGLAVLANFLAGNWASSLVAVVVAGAGVGVSAWFWYKAPDYKPSA